MNDNQYKDKSQDKNLEKNQGSQERQGNGQNGQGQNKNQSSTQGNQGGSSQQNTKGGDQIDTDNDGITRTKGDTSDHGDPRSPYGNKNADKKPASTPTSK